MTDQQPGQQSVSEQSPKTELWGHTRLGILILGVLGLTILGRACHNKPEPSKPGQTEKLPSVKKVEVSNQESQNHELHKSDALPYVPPEGNITIEPKDKTKSLNDLIKIHRQTFGITFEPGISTALLSEPNLGLDAKLLYFGRFGLVGGVLAGSGLSFYVSPMVGVSYRLDRFSYLHNTELWVGVVPLAKIPYQVGLRINL